MKNKTENKHKYKTQIRKNHIAVFALGKNLNPRINCVIMLTGDAIHQSKEVNKQATLRIAAVIYTTSHTKCNLFCNLIENKFYLGTSFTFSSQSCPSGQSVCSLSIYKSTEFPFFICPHLEK